MRTSRKLLFLRIICVVTPLTVTAHFLDFFLLFCSVRPWAGYIENLSELYIILYNQTKSPPYENMEPGYYFQYFYALNLMDLHMYSEAIFYFKTIYFVLFSYLASILIYLLVRSKITPPPKSA